MRQSIPLLTILATILQAPQCDACCLTDWLCGRNTPYVVGYAPVATTSYAAGYAPVATTSYAAGYAPVATTPYAAGYAPVATTPYAAGYAPVATSPYVSGYTPVPTSPYAVGYGASATTSIVSPRMATDPVQAVNNGAYQTQRPTYYDNPSVYTGRPVAPDNAQTSYRVPITTTLRGTGPALPSIGPASQYAQAYQSAYASAAPPVQPITTIPPTTVAPTFAAPPPPGGCGLGRFCGSLLGTSYRTSYYRAPVTYYRPVTSIDPVSGTTVTTQQPCSSYVQQLQRTPYSNLQLGQPAMAQPSTGCNSADCSMPAPMVGTTSPYTISPYGQAMPYGAAPANGIGQVGGVSSTGPTTVPIPSTSQSPDSYYGQPGYAPNLAPLTGAPPTLAPPTAGPSSGGDLAPLDQPRLNSSSAPESLRRESNDSNGNSPTDSPSGTSGDSFDESPTEAPKSFWRLQDAEDSTAMIGSVSRPSQLRRDPASLGGTITGAEPIQAPADYVSPFRSQSIEAPAQAVTRPTFEAPPLPARTYHSSDATSAFNTTSVPVREAALTRNRTQAQPTPQKRDSTWYPIGQ